MWRFFLLFATPLFCVLWPWLNWQRSALFAGLFSLFLFFLLELFSSFWLFFFLKRKKKTPLYVLSSPKGQLFVFSELRAPFCVKTILGKKWYFLPWRGESPFHLLQKLASEKPCEKALWLGELLFLPAPSPLSLGKRLAWLFCESWLRVFRPKVVKSLFFR